jgi:hypothetical protein
MKPIILVIFLFITTSLSQDLGILYRDYFPQDVRLKDSLVTQAAAPLKVYSKLHPDLIYYYIKYLDARFKAPGSDKYYLDNFNKIVCRYKTENVKWLNDLKNQIQLENIDDQLKNLCTDYVDNYSNMPPDEACIDPSGKTDHNLLNFFAVKYYLNDGKYNYDSSIDYQSIRDSLEYEKAYSLKKFMDHPENYTKYELAALFPDWFVYSNTSLSRLNTNVSTVVTDVIQNYSVNEKLYGNTFLSLGFSNLMDNMIVSGNLYVSPDFALPDSEHSFNAQTVSLSFNYKFFLSKYILPFSYINFQLTAGYSLINKSFDGDSLYRMTNVDGISNRNKIMVFYQNSINIKNTEFLSLNISTPVFFLQHRLSLDAGAGIGVFINKYELNYNYTFREFDSEFYAPVVLKEYTSGPVSENSSNTHFTFYPLINIKYFLNRALLIELSASNKIVTLDAGINL